MDTGERSTVKSRDYTRRCCIFRYNFREFYTGWITHWGEIIAKTDATSTTSALEDIPARNGSVVLYMAHGGTNFGFYSGANAAQESDHNADLTSYDYVDLQDNDNCIDL